MSTLLCFGVGYTARHYIADFGTRWQRIIGTVRQHDRITGPALAGCAVETHAFNGSKSSGLADAIAQADAVLVSIPPSSEGDVVLARFADLLAARGNLRIVYLSTVGVYGDHAGAFVDETTPLSPVSTRSEQRAAAEAAWSEFGRRTGQPVALLRLAGIYGPGRNALVNLARGTASRIAKPGQVFNRIHVADVAQAIDAAFARSASGPFNVADDLPAPASEIVLYAAELMKVAPPPEISFAEAQASMSPMSLTFFGESKRARNDKLRRELGVRLKYPTYREGLRALFEAGDHVSPAPARG